MANVNDKGSLIKTRIKTFSDLLKAKRKTLEALLPAHVKIERILILALQALKSNSSLLECDQVSVMASIIQAGALGLEVNSPLNEAYLVPFYNKHKKSKEAQLIIGYPGLIKLMRQSPMVGNIEAHCWYANEEFEYQIGTPTKLIHKPVLNADRGNLKGAYAIVTFTKDNASPLIEVMDLAAINRIRSMSQGKDGFGWRDHFDNMARKCPIRGISKYVPKSIEAATAITWDARADMGESQMDLIDPDVLVELGGNPEDYAPTEPELNPEDEIKPEDMTAGDPANHQDIKKPRASAQQEGAGKTDQPEDKPASPVKDDTELIAREKQQKRFVQIIQQADKWVNLPVAMKIMEGLSLEDKYKGMPAKELEEQLDSVVNLMEKAKEKPAEKPPEQAELKGANF